MADCTIGARQTRLPTSSNRDDPDGKQMGTADPAAATPRRAPPLQLYAECSLLLLTDLDDLTPKRAAVLRGLVESQGGRAVLFDAPQHVGLRFDAERRRLRDGRLRRMWDTTQSRFYYYGAEGGDYKTTWTPPAADAFTHVVSGKRSLEDTARTLRLKAQELARACGRGWLQVVRAQWLVQCNKHRRRQPESAFSLAAVG